MNILLLQSFLLLLASYFLGALLACVAKRAMFGEREEAMAEAVAAPQYESPVPVRPAVVAAPPVRPRTAPPPIAPRPIDPVQPRIEVLRRPDPRPAPKLVDPSRFERALIGPDPNEGVPRKPILEIMPAVFKSPTGPPHPVPKPPPPKSEPVIAKPVAAEPSIEVRPPPAKIAGLADATTAAAAAAVALSKAAAAASTAAAGAKAESEVRIVESKRSDPEPVDDDHETGSSVLAEEPPVQAPAPPPVERKRIETGDDFQRIRAIDDATEQDIKTLGFTYFEDMAGWASDDIKRIDQTLRLNGRIDREQWVEQAQILAKGGDTFYSRNRPGAQKAKTPPVAIVAAEAPEEPDEHEAAEAKHSASAAVESASAPPVEPEIEKASDKLTPSTVAVASATPSSAASAALSGRSVAEMAAAAAAAIAAASASVTRGLRPIEPISPLSKVDPKISIPARLSDAIKEKEAAAQQTKSDPLPPKPAASPAGTGNDLKRIRGIGVLIEKRLTALGINTYDQIANWTSGDIDRVSQLLEFKGRIERESWVEQARILSSGGQTEFSRRVDRGEVDTSRDT